MKYPFKYLNILFSCFGQNLIITTRRERIFNYCIHLSTLFLWGYEGKDWVKYFEGNIRMNLNNVCYVLIMIDGYIYMLINRKRVLSNLQNLGKFIDGPIKKKINNLELILTILMVLCLILNFSTSIYLYYGSPENILRSFTRSHIKSYNLLLYVTYILGYYAFHLIIRKFYDFYNDSIQNMEVLSEISATTIITELLSKNCLIRRLKIQMNNSLGFLVFLFLSNLFVSTFFPIILGFDHIRENIEDLEDYIINSMAILFLFHQISKLDSTEMQMKMDLQSKLIVFKINSFKVEYLTNKLMEELNQSTAEHAMIWRLCPVNYSVLLSFIYVTITFSVMVDTIFNN